MYNRAMVIGRLGRDPEVRFTGGGQCVANFSMATDESWRDKTTGEKKTQTEWHRVVAWRKLAEIIQKYVHKGDLILIAGKLQTREWKDKDGNERQTTEIVADTMKMFGGRRDGQTQRAEDEQHADHDTETHGAPGSDISDEDLPF